MGLCVYCEEEKALTREHIIPSFVHGYQASINKGKTSGWNEKAQSIIGGEAVIKDVCANCNNVVLGELDGHAKSFLDSVGVFTQNFFKDKSEVAYNYKLLSKWLLKVAYNSSRASGKNEGVFDKYKDLILGKTSDYSDFVISAGLLKPLKLTKEQISKHGETLNVNDRGYVNPFFSRISWTPQILNGFSIKQVVIGALVFHVVVFNDGLPRNDRKKFTQQYLTMCKGMTLIRKNAKKVKLVQLPISFLDSMELHMLRPEVQSHFEKLIANR